MMSSDERVYTKMSGMAVKGLQRIARDRVIYVRESSSEHGGYTVVTKGSKLSRSHRKLEMLSA
jgi:hypothetical protein